MKGIIVLVFSIISLSVYSQMDTIYTNNERIPCVVKEVTPEAVKFSYKDEELINTIYKTTIQKIVFKSGRVQNFAEATSFKTVNNAEDFENVTLTSVESEVKGLYKLGDVSSKAKGTTTLSSMVKVKERANRKMKVVAAMMGANVIYLTQNFTSGNQIGSEYQTGNTTETNLSGVAYSNKLPNYDDFAKTIGEKNMFLTFERLKLSGSDADFTKSPFSKSMKLSKLYNESGMIMMDTNIDGVKNSVFRVTNFTSEEFTLVWKDGDTIYNFRVKVKGY